jgi:Peptidase_C39 like family
MANFRVSERGEGITSFVLPKGRSVKFIQFGGGPDNNPLELDLAGDPGLTMTVHGDKLPAASTAFTLAATTAGAKCKVSAYVSGSGKTRSYSVPLSVTVGGAPKRQPGYSVDLLHDVAANGNASDLLKYEKIINGPCDNKHILSQNTTPGKFNCGDVANEYGKKIFKKETYLINGIYYKTGKSDKMADRVATGIGKIKAQLDAGRPVRVWMIHDDGFRFPITNDWRSHYLTIIGYGVNRFLVMDPWPTGSVLTYDGGVFPRSDICFLGELEWNPLNLEMGIRSPAGSAGAHRYCVIAGP